MSTPILSPCIGICSLDEEGYCEGCFRTGEEIAEAMLFMLDHPQECREMGQRGRQLVREKFTLDHMVERTLKVYQKAAGF